MGTLESFNRQFQLNQVEKESVAWAWPFEHGDMMFHIVQCYAKAAQFEGLSAESSFKLQRVSGNILAMLN